LSLVEVRNVYKVFGGRADEAVKMLKAGKSREEVAEATNTVPAVIDVSFEIERGEIFVVMGLSGSGKSTLVRCLNLMHRPTSGAVNVDGRELQSLDAVELRELRAQKISMVFQHFGLFPHRTVLDNAAWGLEVRKLAREERHKRAAEASSSWVSAVGATPTPASSRAACGSASALHEHWRPMRTCC